jgi:hypothetical protein
MILYVKQYNLRIIAYFCMRNNIIRHGEDETIDGREGLT